jgi:hypothetical protein
MIYLITQFLTILSNFFYIIIYFIYYMKHIISYNKITNVYKHVSYIGSISASAIIGILCFFLKHPNSYIGKIIFILAFLKTLFLYDSTIEVYIHHAVVLLFLYFNNPYVYNFNISQPGSIQYVKLGYSIFFTGIFNNLQFYFKNQPHKTILKYLNYCTFLIFRYQFNRAVWNYKVITLLKSYYNQDLVKVYSSYFVMFIISLINTYWTVVIIRNYYIKLKLKLN